ncbi:T6SS phospholipase effector Tle1-like catalytic domain-containing protein [Marinobacter lipolyticus]|uniref:T6SS phospholipase effector Tle1-like catalytic domain-containing protein n=1 Tax=Marinobacter lipolyticus TaxID=209639 RepID=UPI003A8E243E
MQLKRSMDLTPYDIPRIESPFLAASETRRKINAGQFREQELRQLLRLQPYDRVDLCELTVNLVAAGDAFLVHGPLDEGPLSPVVIWRENPDLANGGEWKPSSELPFGLSYPMQDLNRSQLTPQEIKRGPFCMSSPAPASHPHPETDESRQLQPQQAPFTPEPEASVMATTIAGINSGEDAGEQKEEEPEVHVEVGIFTDGTLNNAMNSQELQERLENGCLNAYDRGYMSLEECEQTLAMGVDTSYANSPTNIAKLWGAYPDEITYSTLKKNYQYSIYSPGAGTKTGSGDSLLGAATGLGETGVLEQVTSAFEQLVHFISIDLSSANIDKLTIDLFGFSRGAAAARHAANDISQGTEGILGQLFSQKGLKWPADISIRFLGLFDTVAGIVNLKNGDFSAQNNYNKPVNLYIDPSKVENVLHLTALDEKRGNFALNSIRSPDTTLPSNFTEIAIPGAHSDIGGGYPDILQEDIFISPRLLVPNTHNEWPTQTLQWDNLQSLENQINNEKWVGSFSLPLKKKTETFDGKIVDSPTIKIDRDYRPHPAPRGQMELILRMIRMVRGEYSRIPLRMMHYGARLAGVPFKELDTFDDNIALPEELSLMLPKFKDATQKHLKKIQLTTQETMLIKQRYTHYSAHFNDYQTLIMGTPARISFLRNLRPHAPTTNRVIHPNAE